MLAAVAATRSTFADLSANLGIGFRRLREEDPSDEAWAAWAHRQLARMDVPMHDRHATASPVEWGAETDPRLFEAAASSGLATPGSVGVARAYDRCAAAKAFLWDGRGDEPEFIAAARPKALQASRLARKAARQQRAFLRSLRGMAVERARLHADPQSRVYDDAPEPPFPARLPITVDDRILIDGVRRAKIAKVLLRELVNRRAHDLTEARFTSQRSVGSVRERDLAGVPLYTGARFTCERKPVGYRTCLLPRIQQVAGSSGWSVRSVRERDLAGVPVYVVTLVVNG